MKKWYIGERLAEGEAIFFVELSEVEVKAVRRFIEAQANGPCELYSGSFSMNPVAFDSLEEAETFAKKESGYYFSEDEWAEYRMRKIKP